MTNMKQLPTLSLAVFLLDLAMASYMNLPLSKGAFELSSSYKRQAKTHEEMMTTFSSLEKRNCKVGDELQEQLFLSPSTHMSLG